MRFILDAMLPPACMEILGRLGHEATTPLHLGAANLSDRALVEIAIAKGRGIVTEKRA